MDANTKDICTKTPTTLAPISTLAEYICDSNLLEIWKFVSAERKNHQNGIVQPWSNKFLHITDVPQHLTQP